MLQEFTSYLESLADGPTGNSDSQRVQLFTNDFLEDLVGQSPGTGFLPTAQYTQLEPFLSGRLTVEGVVAQLRACKPEFHDFKELLGLFRQPKDILYVSKDRFSDKPLRFGALLEETLRFELIDRRDNWVLTKSPETLHSVLIFAANKVAAEVEKTTKAQAADHQPSDFERNLQEALETNKAYRSSKHFRPKVVYDDRLPKTKPKPPSKLEKKRQQLKELEAQKRPEYQLGKVISMREIANTNKFDNRRKIGLRCFELTNDFRQAQGLSVLRWSDEMFYICLTHSEDMALGKAAFGHGGFDNRLKLISFGFSTASENVAYCEGGEEEALARETVTGWINSPGHRKNMVSTASVSAVAAYCKEGGNRYYFTQMFALR